MAKGSTSKCQKSAMATRNSQKIDRISSLPDPLLCHILSFLSTKEAVATSVLSPRWTSICSSVLVLDIKGDWPCFSKIGSTSFSDVVSKMLVQHKEQCIKRFHLSIPKQLCDQNLIEALLSVAVNRDLEEVDLSLVNQEKAISLPSKLFTCQAISILRLSGRINVNLIPSSIHFPSLKTLDLCGLHLANDEPIRRILSGCPILEEFYAEVKIDPSPTLRICVPSLKLLHICSTHCKVERLEINNTPSLESICVDGVISKDYLIENLDNLVEAHLDIFFELDDEEKNNVPKLFQGIQSTKFLWLSDMSTEVLTWACLPFPVFQNLVHLELLLQTLDSYFLVELLLEKCPVLEVLDIEKIDFESEIEWTEPTAAVPSCLMSHLTEFKFNKIEGSTQEMELAEYFLRNAQVLKTATFQIESWLQTEELDSVMAKLNRMPKASQDCQKHFQVL